MNDARVVALGGGHGLYSSLSALRRVCSDITAIVTVADDGGSSGRLRRELGILPPGDLRMALSALCDEGDWGTLWRDVLQTRFSSPGSLDGHALGNLLIAGLWDRTGDVVEGLEWVARLLKAQGTVLPLAQEPLEIAATVDGPAGRSVARGQVAVAKAKGVVSGLGIVPSMPSVPPQTLAAIDAADAVILGPGSWYTSVLVHFLVEPVAEALVRASNRSILTLNIAFEDIETEGTDRVDDIRALRSIEPRFTPAVVLADASHDDEELREEVAQWGPRLIVADMRDMDAVDRHDVTKLALALSRSIDACEGTRGSRGMAG